MHQFEFRQGRIIRSQPFQKDAVVVVVRAGAVAAAWRGGEAVGHTLKYCCYDSE